MADKIVDFSSARAARNDGTDEPSHIFTVGGLVDETGVSLCVYGDDLVPDEISRMLGVAPTRAYRKGQRMKSRAPNAPPNVTHRTGAWILSVRGQAPREPKELTTALLDQLPEDETVWAELEALRRSTALRLAHGSLEPRLRSFPGAGRSHCPSARKGEF